MRASTAAVRSTRSFAAGAKSVLGWIDGCNSTADEKSSMALSSVFIAGMGVRIDAAGAEKRLAGQQGPARKTGLCRSQPTYQSVAHTIPSPCPLPSGDVEAPCEESIFARDARYSHWP